MRQFKSVAIKQYNRNSGLTLAELLIAVCIFSLIVIGFSTIATFSHFQVMTSDRRVKLQNDASYVLEHMAKNVGLGIGSNATGNPGVIKHSVQEWIKVRWDRNLNGQPDDNGPNDWIAYRYVPAQNEVDYYTTFPYSGWPAGGSEILSQKITRFVCSIEYNYVFVEITACADPDGSPFACGTLDNPQLTMKNRINMPAVSTH